MKVNHNEIQIKIKAADKRKTAHSKKDVINTKIMKW